MQVQKMNWSWDSLRYFLAVAEHGTLTDAAIAMGVSHTTVQRRLVAFEKELHTQLLARTRQGYVLTDAGRTLYNEASKVQSTLTSITSQISNQEAQPSGAVTITSTDTICSVILPDIIRELIDQYPKLEITLDNMNRISDIRNFEADIAIRTCKKPPENLIGRKIGRIHFVVCASTDYIKRHKINKFPTDVSDYHFIKLNSQYSDVEFYQWFDKVIQGRASTTIVSDFMSARSLCAAGVGITILPSYLLPVTENLRELKVSTAPTPNDLWLLSHSDLRDTERVKVARHFLYERLSSCVGE